MVITLETGEGVKRANLREPLSISLPLQDGRNNPNCYWADDPEFKPIVKGDFIGDVSRGGPVNYNKISFTPHGNGTHTECLGHITREAEPVNQSLSRFHFIAELLTLKPAQYDGNELILLEDYKKLRKAAYTEAVIVRTLPNEDSKKYRRYSGTNPPFFAPEILKDLAESGVLHLVTDLPSVDKEVDEGRLTGHNYFWSIPRNKRIESTITELAYIPETIIDGIYLLNLQILNIALDASPSNPVIYKLY